MDCTTSMLRRFDALLVYFSFFQKITKISPFFGSFFLHFLLFWFIFFTFPSFLVYFFYISHYFGSFFYIFTNFWFIFFHFTFALVVFPTNQCVHPSALMLHHPDCTGFPRILNWCKDNGRSDETITGILEILSHEDRGGFEMFAPKTGCVIWIFGFKRMIGELYTS